MKRDCRYAYWTDFPYGDAPRQHNAYEAFRDKGLAAFWQACYPSQKNRCPTAYADRAFMFLDARLKTPREIREAHTPRGGKTLRAPCPGCGGNGRLDWVRCGSCRGTGKIGVMYCATCLGTRYVPYPPAPACRLCDGKGFRMEYRQPKVPVFCNASLSRGYRLEASCANKQCEGRGHFILRSTPAQKAYKGNRKAALMNGIDNKIVSFCETCRGMGRGLPHCRDCNGTGFATDPTQCRGKIPPPYMKCSSTGWRFETCTACNGLGAVWESYGPTDEEIETGAMERAYYATERDEIIAKKKLSSLPKPVPARSTSSRLLPPAKGETKGWIGILVDRKAGALTVAKILSGSPAAASKLAEGDVITTLGETPINTLGELREAVGNTPPGNTCILSILRNGKSRKIQITAETCSSPKRTLSRRNEL